MHVSQILSTKGTDVHSIAPTGTVAELAAELNSRRVGALIVKDSSGAVVGIVSERDVVRGLASDASVVNAAVESIMTKDVVSIDPDFEVADLTRLMTEKRIRHVPVIDNGGVLVGLVSIGDVVKVRMDELETERAALMEYITQGG
ncbi:MAG: CBS domain-containing protein [Actinomycetota bacterium]|nr:CBS domain-containing protein [Actinomycetota bacterium]